MGDGFWCDICKTLHACIHSKDLCVEDEKPQDIDEDVVGFWSNKVVFDEFKNHPLEELPFSVLDKMHAHIQAAMDERGRYCPVSGDL